MKKFLAILFTAIFLAIDVVVLWAVLKKDEPVPDVPPVDGGQVEAPMGDVEIEVNGVYQVTVGTEAVELGAESETVVIYGGSEGATLRATGEGNGTIRASAGGQLIVKDMMIEDKRANAYTNAYSNYLRFGGKVRFENCTFKDVIYVKDDAEAEFINCSFNSPKSKYYAVWVGDGSASFEGCTFTGYRGMKIHEFEEYAEDVTKVTINNCEFRDLIEKVGIAIGVFTVEPLKTVVIVTNSRFINNQAWDTVGSLAGVDSFYETDMYTNEYVFVEKNNVIQFTAKADDEYWTPNY